MVCEATVKTICYYVINFENVLWNGWAKTMLLINYK